MNTIYHLEIYRVTKETRYKVAEAFYETEAQCDKAYTVFIQGVDYKNTSYEVQEKKLGVLIDLK